MQCSDSEVITHTTIDLSLKNEIVYYSDLLEAYLSALSEARWRRKIGLSMDVE
jgi:hypothetical protein